MAWDEFGGGGHVLYFDSDPVTWLFVETARNLYLKG